MTLQQFEDDIKRHLFPYDTFLKISKIGDHVDSEAMIVDNRQQDEFAWAALESECTYPDL